MQNALMVFSKIILFIFRGSRFPKNRGNRGNKESRPIRHVYNNFPETLRNEEDISNNEVSIDDNFSYESSAEFESSKLYKKLRTNSNRGYYHSP